MTPLFNRDMILAPITAEDYYKSLLTVVDYVEHRGSHVVREKLKEELAAMRALNLSQRVWVPQEEEEDLG